VAPRFLAAVAFAGLISVLTGCTSAPPASDPQPGSAGASPSALGTASAEPTGLVGDLGTWTDDQRAAVDMVDEFNAVMSEVAGNPATSDYTRLLDVASDPAYSQLAAELIHLHAAGDSLSGPVWPVSRSVGKVLTTLDGREEITVVQCDDISAVARNSATGSMVPLQGESRVTYTYTLERLTDLGWRVIVYQGGIEAC
jgi:hypothetical protein